MVDDRKYPCPYTSCRCTHDRGCVEGWLEARPYTMPRADGQPGADGSGLASYPRVTPCPTCFPEKVARLGETRAQWLARLSGRVPVS
jgi:hypothetical protein